MDDYSASKADFARFLTSSLAKSDLEQLRKAKESKPDLPPDLWARITSGVPLTPVTDFDHPISVGIIGAGISGLYTAYILKYLNGIIGKPYFKYEILEANPHRIGGRLYTHHFGKGDDEQYQYYDVGAMRFPDTEIMARTFNLLRELKIEKGDYIMRANGTPMRYNDITQILPISTKIEDPFLVSVKNKGPVPIETVKNADEILQDAYFPYRRKIKRALEARALHKMTFDENFTDPQKSEWQVEMDNLESKLGKAWQYLLQHDKFSLRDYLSFVEGQDDDSIHWLETLNAGTGWFDQSFSENVMESLAFEYHNKSDEEDPKPGPPVNLLWLGTEKKKEVKWNYIVGGSRKLSDRTAEEIGLENIKKGKMVTAMKLVYVSPSSDKNATEKKAPIQVKIPKEARIQVKIRNEAEPKEYDTVFCSTTFAAMQKMDLTGLNLPYRTKAAIRSLRYDPSSKVAIQFKKAWWIKSDSDKGITGIRGGLGRTDMPLRTCVYPSYNLEAEGPAVLLCSYTWGQDSERIASMIDPVVPTDEDGANPTTNGNNDKYKNETLLKETMIDNLARLHSKEPGEYESMHKLISDSYIQHHAYDWSKDPYTCGGAFALFSASQFRRIYPSVVFPLADSRLHIIGEAASAHHAWVVGALDSAARGVYMMLRRFKLFYLCDALETKFGVVEEIDKETVDAQIAAGMLKKKDEQLLMQPFMF